MQVTFKNKNRIPCEENPLWIKSPSPCPQLTQSAADVVMFEKFAIPRNIRSSFRENVNSSIEYLSRQGFSQI